MAVDIWKGYRRPQQDDIPIGWIVKRLREIATFAAGGRLGLTMSDFKENGYPAYSAEGLTGFVDRAEFKGPAVIVSSIGEKCGKCFYAEGEFTTLANVQVVFPNADAINPYYLWNLVNDARFWPRAQTAQPFIRPSDIKKSWIPIPTDSYEQSAIAELLRLTDKTLDAARAELLAAQRLKTALMQQLFTKGIPGRHKRFKDTKIGKVPEEWDVVQLKNLLTSSQYGLSESFSQRGQYQILRMMNIEDGFVNTRDPVYIDLDDTTYQNYRVEVGDILFNRTNSLELVGRVGIVRDRFEAVFASYLVRLKANTEKVNPFFLNYCLNSYRVKCRYRRFATPAVGQANINPRSLKTTLIAIPKRESGEQEDIVELISNCDQVIETITKKQNALGILKKSLLQNLLTGKVRVNMEAQV